VNGSDLNTDLAGLLRWKRDIILKKHHQPSNSIIFQSRQLSACDIAVNKNDPAKNLTIMAVNRRSLNFLDDNNSLRPGHDFHTENERGEIVEAQYDETNVPEVSEERLLPINKNPILVLDMEKRHLNPPQSTSQPLVTSPATVGGSLYFSSTIAGAVNDKNAFAPSKIDENSTRPEGDRNGHAAFEPRMDGEGGEDVFSEEDESMPYGKGFVNRLLKRFSGFSSKDELSADVGLLPVLKSPKRSHGSDTGMDILQNSEYHDKHFRKSVPETLPNGKVVPREASGVNNEHNERTNSELTRGVTHITSSQSAEKSIGSQMVVNDDMYVDDDHLQVNTVSNVREIYESFSPPKNTSVKDERQHQHVPVGAPVRLPHDDKQQVVVSSSAEKSNDVTWIVTATDTLVQSKITSQTVLPAVPVTGLNSTSHVSTGTAVPMERTNGTKLQVRAAVPVGRSSETTQHVPSNKNLNSSTNKDIKGSGSYQNHENVPLVGAMPGNVLSPLARDNAVVGIKYEQRPAISSAPQARSVYLHSELDKGKQTDPSSTILKKEGIEKETWLKNNIVPEQRSANSRTFSRDTTTQSTQMIRPFASSNKPNIVLPKDNEVNLSLEKNNIKTQIHASAPTVSRNFMAKVTSSEGKGTTVSSWPKVVTKSATVGASAMPAARVVISEPTVNISKPKVVEKLEYKEVGILHAPQQDVVLDKKTNAVKRQAPSRPGNLIIRPASNTVASKTKTEFLNLSKYNDVKKGEFAPAAARKFASNQDNAEEEESVDDLVDSSEGRTTYEFIGAGMRLGRSVLMKKHLSRANKVC